MWQVSATTRSLRATSPNSASRASWTTWPARSPAALSRRSSGAARHVPRFASPSRRGRVAAAVSAPRNGSWPTSVLAACRPLQHPVHSLRRRCSRVLRRHLPFRSLRSIQLLLPPLPWTFSPRTQSRRPNRHHAPTQSPSSLCPRWSPHQTRMPLPQTASRWNYTSSFSTNGTARRQATRSVHTSTRLSQAKCSRKCSSKCCAESPHSTPPGTRGASNRRGVSPNDGRQNG